MDTFYGLVVCGGLSTRMGKDKSLLQYHDIPQLYYVFDLLQQLCNKTFISCNKTQAESIPEMYPVIVDSQQYTAIGPMAALLSAFEEYPDATLLVCGCDYPFINREHLEALKNGDTANDVAVAYYNEVHGFYEPLLALYKPESHQPMLDYFANGDYSLNHFLKDAGAAKLMAPSPEILKSIDTQAEYERALKQLGRQ